MVNDPNRYYKNKNVAKSYDEIRFTSLPGKVFDTLERLNTRKAFRALELGPNTAIINAPCGTGRLVRTVDQGRIPSS